MRDRTRRTELGKMFIDVAKYVLTIVVIGGLVAEQVHAGSIVLGLVFSTSTAAIGFLVIPPEEGGA